MQVAATVLTLASMLADGTSPFESGRQGVFGWPTDLRYLPSIAWLAAGPGVLGHTSLAALLKWMHPLQVSLRSADLFSLVCYPVACSDQRLLMPCTSAHHHPRESGASCSVHWSGQTAPDLAQ